MLDRHLQNSLLDRNFLTNVGDCTAMDSQRLCLSGSERQEIAVLFYEELSFLTIEVNCSVTNIEPSSSQWKITRVEAHEGDNLKLNRYGEASSKVPGGLRLLINAGDSITSNILIKEPLIRFSSGPRFPDQVNDGVGRKVSGWCTPARSSYVRRELSEFWYDPESSRGNVATF